VLMLVASSFLTQNAAPGNSTSSDVPERAK